MKKAESVEAVFSLEHAVNSLSYWIGQNLYHEESRETNHEASLSLAWDHFKLCCLEMIIYILFIYFLKTKLCFDVLGDGPIAMLINTVRNNS